LISLPLFKDEHSIWVTLMLKLLVELVEPDETTVNVTGLL
jgi:hypothetical protein